MAMMMMISASFPPWDDEMERSCRVIFDKSMPASA